MKFPRVHIAIKGAVQGVGFRPFVYRTAQRHGITGWVRNDVSGVEIEAVGTEAHLAAFTRSLKTNHPPLARIRSLDISECEPCKPPEAFRITESSLGEAVEVDVTCDAAVCEACLGEMNDSNDRRYRHPFINCTDCGPRFTIIKLLPYDRPNTTMAAFAPCDDCKKEYESPESRRFHAQPVCCPKCGPKLSLHDNEGKAIDCEDPIAQCAGLLLQGKIVAIKGIGGFHLACRADSQAGSGAAQAKKNAGGKAARDHGAGHRDGRSLCSDFQG